MTAPDLHTARYRCTSCGKTFSNATGHCYVCKKWGCVAELVEGLSGSGLPTVLSMIPRVEEDKIPTGVPELDRALDGGWPKASCIVIGGEPGIGKSTLLLQAAAAFPSEIGPVLYVSSEEAPSKIGSRADRLRVELEKQANVTVLNEGDGDRIIAVGSKLKAALYVVDSVQTTAFPPDDAGSVLAAENLAKRFFKLAHLVGCIVVLVCHVTKDGELAGPKKLEHFVDTVLEFDSDRRTDWRTLLSLKNRSGATPRIGIFKMTAEGLVSVEDPAKEMVDTIDPDASGWALGVQTEDRRSWIVQAQCLLGEVKVDEEGQVIAGKLHCSGCSQTRVKMLLAVLEARCSVDLSGRDIFVNVVGGRDKADPGLDLAIAGAVLSARVDLAMHKDAVLVGEVGLLGEVLRADGYDNRVALAERYGFSVWTPAKLKDLVDVANKSLDSPEDGEQL